MDTMSKQAAKASVEEMGKFMEYMENVGDWDAVLEDWRIVEYSNNHAYAYGKIYGDKKGRFKDGEPVRTSIVVIWNKPAGRIVTENSLYKLGKPDLTTPQSKDE